MQHALKSILSTLARKAPFLKHHEKHVQSEAERLQWFRLHYPNQQIETDPKSAVWLRHAIPSKGRSWQYIQDTLPCLRWLPRYQISWMIGDMTAGLTVGAVVIPQGMAYARLAELPVEMGLYSAFTGSLLYFLFGSSKDINVGPIAIASIITGSIVDEIQTTLPQESRVEIAGLIALLAGSIIFLMSVLRLGWLMNLISLPAIAAFVSGVSITITATQLSTLLGIKDIEESDAAYAILLNTFKRLGDTRIDAVLGITALCLLYAIKCGTALMAKRQHKQAKFWSFLSTVRTVFVILGFILASYLVNRTRTRPAFRVLGPVPRGFHGTFKPRFSHDLLKEVLPNLPTMVIVLLIEHLSIAKSFARLNDYTVNADSELLAIGASNIVGPFIGAYAISGSFSRTAINAKAGSRTPLAGVVTAILVVIAIYLLTPMLFYVPNAVLSAVIIHAIIDLVTSPTALYQFWRSSPLDLLVFFTGITIMVFLDVEIGLYTAIGLSMIFYLWNVLHARVHRLSAASVSTLRSGTTTAPADAFLHNRGKAAHTVPLPLVEHHNMQRTICRLPPGVFVYRLTESFIYMNAYRVLDEIMDVIKKETRPTELLDHSKQSHQPWSAYPPPREVAGSTVQSRPMLQAIVLDFSAVNHIDTTAVQALVDARASLKRYTYPEVMRWHFAHVHSRWTRRALASAGFGQPDFSTKTGEPEDFPERNFMANRTLGMDSHQEMHHCEPKPDTSDVRVHGCTNLGIDVPAGEGVGPSSAGVRQHDCTCGENRSEVLYSINRPYFHPNVAAALESISCSLERGRHSRCVGSEAIESKGGDRIV